VGQGRSLGSGIKGWSAGAFLKLPGSDKAGLQKLCQPFDTDGKNFSAPGNPEARLTAPEGVESRPPASYPDVSGDGYYESGLEIYASTRYCLIPG